MKKEIKQRRKHGIKDQLDWRATLVTGCTSARTSTFPSQSCFTGSVPHNDQAATLTAQS